MVLIMIPDKYKTVYRFFGACILALALVLSLVACDKKELSTTPENPLPAVVPAFRGCSDS
jgi:hypothetical protein